MLARTQVSHPRVLLFSGFIAATLMLAGPAGLAFEPAATGASTGFTVLDASGAGTASYQGTAATVIDASGNVAGIYIDAKKVEHAFVRYASNGAIVTFDAPGAGQDADLFQFATDADNSQRAEIRIMQGMLEENR